MSIAIAFAAIIGGTVALATPAGAFGFGLALCASCLLDREDIGLLVLAMGFSSGALSGALIRLSYLAL